MGASVSQDSQVLKDDHQSDTHVPKVNDVKKDNPIALNSMDTATPRKEQGLAQTREEKRPVILVSSSNTPITREEKRPLKLASLSSTAPITNSKQQERLPHNYECIIKDADDKGHLNLKDNQKLLECLHSGVFLNQKTIKYWIEMGSDHNCFMLFPRSLAITWGEDGRYWRWFTIKQPSSTSEVMVEVSELRNVCWLEIHGKFDITYLSPGVKYEVVFVVMITPQAYGWDVPVNLKLQLPYETTTHPQQQHHKENLKDKPKMQSIELPVGEFETPPLSAALPQPPPNKREIQFSMFEYEGGKWKRGLVMKGVIIRPKK